MKVTSDDGRDGECLPRSECLQRRQVIRMSSSERTRPVPIEIEPATIHKTLESILQSAPFRTSKQCQDMLRYVVEHSLRDEQESLRERMIGIEVFGRSTDYDTSGDPVVRIRAADIRKRLAQYYQNPSSSDASVHIEIPSGSYRAVFTAVTHASPAPVPVLVSETHRIDAVDTPVILAPVRAKEQTSSIRRRNWILPLLAVVAIVLAAAATWLWRSQASRSPDAVEAFWAPVFASRKPVIIYAGANAVYRLSDQFLERYRKEHHIDNAGPEIFVHLPPAERIAAEDLIPVGDTTEDGRACALLVSLITRAQRPYELRYGTDISVGDLQDSPTVLVGAFNNPWTLKMSDSLRFVFRDGNRIEDTWHKLPGWSVASRPNGDRTDDYAVISRLIDPRDGHVLIMAAGIGSFGTETAAEFLTNSQEMGEATRKAPSGWQKKNVQIVLHVTVRDVLDSENVVATQYW
jgi:hypothetical protein